MLTLLRLLDLYGAGDAIREFLERPARLPTRQLMAHDLEILRNELRPPAPPLEENLATAPVAATIVTEIHYQRSRSGHR